MKQLTRLLLTLTSDDDNNQPLTIITGTATAIITLNRDLRVSDSYSFFLYNDENMLLDYAETGTESVERRGRSMLMDFSRPLVWLPGHYFLLMRTTGGLVLRFDITLDEHGTFTATGPRRCGALSDEDLLSERLCMQKQLWLLLSQMPGMRQFRQKALEWARQAEIKSLCDGLVETGDIPAGNNFIIDTQGSELARDAVIQFWEVAKMKGNLKWVDCSMLYDATNNNPYEKLNEVCEDSDKVLCLTNVGALLDNGGKVVMKKLRRQYERFVIVGTQTETANLLEQNPSWRALFPKENHISVEPMTARNSSSILCCEPSR